MCTSTMVSNSILLSCTTSEEILQISGKPEGSDWNYLLKVYKYGFYLSWDFYPDQMGASFFTEPAQLVK